MWNLSRPGIEPVSPALAGGFFTTQVHHQTKLVKNRALYLMQREQFIRKVQLDEYPQPTLFQEYTEGRQN